MEKTITQNGGKYSAELTKKCTHLISDISFLMVCSDNTCGFEFMSSFLSQFYMIHTHVSFYQESFEMPKLIFYCLINF